jgi:hypothetical protein
MDPVCLHDLEADRESHSARHFGEFRAEAGRRLGEPRSLNSSSGFSKPANPSGAPGSATTSEGSPCVSARVPRPRRRRPLRGATPDGSPPGQSHRDDQRDQRVLPRRAHEAGGAAHHLVVQGWDCLADTGTYGTGSIGRGCRGRTARAGCSTRVSAGWIRAISEVRVEWMKPTAAGVRRQGAPWSGRS